MDETSGAEFYAQRDPRSEQYLNGAGTIAAGPVGLFLAADAIEHQRSMLLVRGLVNMLARFHRRIHLHLPVGQQAVGVLEELRGIATSINPYIRIEDRWSGDEVATLGVGAADAVDCQWYVGCDRQSALLNTCPVVIDEQDGASLGAMLGACVGASTAFQLAAGLKGIASHRVSAWVDGDLEDEPEELPALDVGRILQLGAGGVGSSFAYWMSNIDRRGDLVIVDGDACELSNTNRSLGMNASDAGYRAPVRNKAEVAAAVARGRAIQLFHTGLTEQDWEQADVVALLANDRGVRAETAGRGKPVVLQASTSSEWQALADRHLCGIDGCCACRYPSSELPRLACATVSVKPSDSGQTSQDAALAFLTGGGGVLLLSWLFRLQLGIARGKVNQLRWLPRNVRYPRLDSRHECPEGCFMHGDWDKQRDRSSRWAGLASSPAK